MSRNAKRSKGSAYVEALIVTGLFTVLFMWTLSFGRSRLAMLQGVQQRREAAFTHTSQPCPDRAREAALAFARETLSTRAQALLRAALPAAAPQAPANIDCNELSIEREHATTSLEKLLHQVAP